MMGMTYDVVVALCGKKRGIRDAFSEFGDIDHSTTPSPPSSPPSSRSSSLQYEHPGIDWQCGHSNQHTCRTKKIASLYNAKMVPRDGMLPTVSAAVR